ERDNRRRDSGVGGLAPERQGADRAPPAGSLPAPDSSPGCSGRERVRQTSPRSLSSASMHSTSSWIEASPEKVSVRRPPGGSPGSKLTASRDRTRLPEGLTFFNLAPNTRSNLSAVRLRR